MIVSCARFLAPFGPVALTLTVVACGAIAQSPDDSTRNGGAPNGVAPASPTDDAAARPTVCGDTRSDPDHCGRCDHRCLGGTCSGGRCQPVALTTFAREDVPFALALGATDVVYTTYPGKLFKLPKTGGTPSVLVPQFGLASFRNADGLVVLDERAYYSIYYDAVVRAVPLAGGAFSVVSSPRAGTLASDGTNVFAASLEGSFGVYRWTPGTAPASFAPVSLGHEEPIGGLVADGRFVFARTPTAIARAPLAGGPREALAQSTCRTIEGCLLRGDATSLYFLETESPTSTTSSLWQVPKAGGPKAKLADEASTVGGFAVDDAFVYFALPAIDAGNSAPGALAQRRAIARVSKMGGSAEELTRTTSFHVDSSAIVVDDAAIYYFDYTSDGSAGRLMKLAK